MQPFSRQSAFVPPLEALGQKALQTIPDPGLWASPRAAVLMSFCEPVSKRCLSLEHLSRAEWKRLLHWLDVSGLALYFLDRLAALDRCDILPANVLARLRQNQTDNIARTQGMIAESIAIQRAFQAAGVRYAVLKGLSLCPDSVPRPELRHQFDLDFLVDEASAAAAREILLHKGYRLYAASGRSLEFKRDERPAVSMRDFYKDQPGRTVELHLEAPGSYSSSRLARVDLRSFAGMDMPVLSPTDLFLGQALHVYKDICSSFCRASHLLELRRHVVARHDDRCFWQDLRAAAESDPRARVGLGVAVQFITQLTGHFAPEALTAWTVDGLPASILLWIELYGSRAAYADVPGSKFYLLLQKELEAAGLPGRRSVKKALLPSRLPPFVIRSTARETAGTRIKRYRLQLDFLLSRARFHTWEGVRYARESRRWRQHLRRLL